MGRKRRNSAEALLEELRSEQSINSQHESQAREVETPTPPSNNGNTTPSLSAIETLPQAKEDPLLVKIIDTTTKEITSQKMTANEVWHMAKNLKVMVELNGDGHGDDNGANLLVRFLGKLARTSTLCPIYIENWHLVPKAKKVQLWKLVEDNFLFDYVAGCTWVMSTLGERLKAYKYQLRCKYFYLFNSKEELLANPPTNVDSSDWSAFVRYYHSDKMKTISSQNTRSRKKLKVPHAGGSKSNARKASQMVKKLGRPVCQSEVVLSTLLKKNGSYVNEEAETIAAKISENLTQDQEHAASSGVPSKIFAEPNDALGKVFGPERPGRVRGLGIGACPSKVFGIQGQFVGSVESTTPSANIPEVCIQDLVKEVSSLQENLVGYEETKAEL